MKVLHSANSITSFMGSVLSKPYLPNYRELICYTHWIIYSEDTRTINTWYSFYTFLVTIECRLVLSTRVFIVSTPTKCYICSTIRHKKSLYSFVVEKKMYTKMSIKCKRFECPYCKVFAMVLKKIAELNRDFNKMCK